MATAMDNTRSIELPNELWQRVFFFASQNTISRNDHVKLWTSVRAVSRSWRAIITREYLDAYIKDPERCLIYWNAGGDWVPDIEAGMIHHFELEMTFDRFDKDTNGEEDKTRVVFAKQISYATDTPACRLTRAALDDSNYAGPKNRSRSVVHTESSAARQRTYRQTFETDGTDLSSLEATGMKEMLSWAFWHFLVL